VRVCGPVRVNGILTSGAPADDHQCPCSSHCYHADAPLSGVHQQTITTAPAAASIVNTPVPLPSSAPVDDCHRIVCSYLGLLTDDPPRGIHEQSIATAPVSSTHRPDASASTSSAPADDHHCPCSSHRYHADASCEECTSRRSPPNQQQHPSSTRQCHYLRAHRQTIATAPAAAIIANHR
jgi:hypothetical protein